MSETTVELEEVKTQIARLEAELKVAKARARALRPTKAKAEPKLCADGCGELTRGGDFLPGHDARFRGQMLKAIDAGDESAIATLLARPTLLHGQTEADLRARLGSDQRKQEAQVERDAQRQAAKAQREAEVRAERKANARLKAKSREEQFAAQERRRANKERAVAAAASGQM